MVAWVICLVLAAWFLLSAVAQIRRPLPLRVRRLDWFGFLPRWNFFAPHPIVGDVVVEYRVGPDAGWRRLEVPANRWFDVVWPRHRRSRKALVASANETLTVYRLHPDEPGDVALSIPYLVLLGRATQEVQRSAGGSVQFRVLHLTYSESGPTATVMFRSAIHAVRPAEAVHESVRAATPPAAPRDGHLTLKTSPQIGVTRTSRAQTDSPSRIWVDVLRAFPARVRTGVPR
jgi:hypothetical protein